MTWQPAAEAKAQGRHRCRLAVDAQACSAAPRQERASSASPPISRRWRRRADFIHEAAPEREELKIKLFRDIDAIARPDVIIASSSSGFLPTGCNPNAPHPERVIIGHPFNPVYLLPLVETVPGEKTSPRRHGPRRRLFRIDRHARAAPQEGNRRLYLRPPAGSPVARGASHPRQGHRHDRRYRRLPSSIRPACAGPSWARS